MATNVDKGIYQDTALVGDMQNQLSDAIEVEVVDDVPGEEAQLDPAAIEGALRAIRNASRERAQRLCPAPACSSEI